MTSDVRETGEAVVSTDASEPAAAPLRQVSHPRVDEQQEVRSSPCTRCPWRTDTDLTAFSDREMDMLRRADGRPGDDAPMDAPTVACHRDQPGTAHAWRWCAGWLARAGQFHHRVRLAHVFGAVPVDSLAPKPGWPELYPGLDALLSAREAQLGRSEPDGTIDACL